MVAREWSVGGFVAFSLGGQAGMHLVEFALVFGLGALLRWNVSLMLCVWEWGSGADGIADYLGCGVSWRHVWV